MKESVICLPPARDLQMSVDSDRKDIWCRFAVAGGWTYMMSDWEARCSYILGKKLAWLHFEAQLDVSGGCGV